MATTQYSSAAINKQLLADGEQPLSKAERAFVGLERRMSKLARLKKPARRKQSK